MNGNGFITFLTAGTYILNTTFTLARTGSSGGATALVLTANYGNPASTNKYATLIESLVGATDIKSISNTIIVNVSESDVTTGGGLNTLYYGITRDSALSSGAGASEGGLYGFDVQALPVPNVNPSEINISLLVA